MGELLSLAAHSLAVLLSAWLGFRQNSWFVIAWVAILVFASVQGQSLLALPPGNYYLQYVILYLPALILLAVYGLVRSRASKLYRLIDRLMASNHELSSITDNLGSQNELQNNVILGLEKRILEEQSFGLKLQQAISGFASSDVYTTRSRVVEITQEFIRTPSASFYYMEGNSLILGAHSKGKSPPRQFSLTDPLILALSEEHGPRTLRDLAETRDFVMGCLLRNATGSPIGLLLIHELDLLELTTPTVNLFQILCSWVAMELDKSERQESLRLEYVKVDTLRHFYHLVYLAALRSLHTNTSCRILTMTFPYRQSMSSEAFENAMSSLFTLLDGMGTDLICDQFFNEKQNDRLHILTFDLETDLAPALQELPFTVVLEVFEISPDTSPDSVQQFLDRHVA